MKLIIIALLLTGCATFDDRAGDVAAQNAMAANPNPYVFVNVAYRVVVRYFNPENEGEQ